MFDWMRGFARDLRDQGLCCDGVPLADIARDAGTPVHVYSGGLIADRYAQLDAAFAGYPHRLHYAIKANSTLAVVRQLRSLGARADANSIGEIEVARRAGFAPGDVVFTGVGKTADEIRRAVAAGLETINVESPGELDRITAAARLVGRPARVAIRLNPDVDAGTHRHISTGLPATKFGVSQDDALAMARRAGGDEWVRVVGLHAHIGSQITKADPLRQAAEGVAAFAMELAAAGVPLEHLDLGGGLGIAYTPDQTVLTPAEYAAALLPAVQPTGLTLVLEPGRWLVGPAGVIVTTVVDLEAQARRRVVRRRRRRDDGPAAARALRRVASDRARAAPHGRDDARRRRGAGVRDDRHAGVAADVAGGRGGGPARDSRHRRVRRGDGVELQSTPDGRRGARTRRAVVRRTAPPDN